MTKCEVRRTDYKGQKAKDERENSKDELRRHSCCYVNGHAQGLSPCLIKSLQRARKLSVQPPRLGSFWGESLLAHTGGGHSKLLKSVAAFVTV